MEVEKDALEMEAKAHEKNNQKSSKPNKGKSTPSRQSVIHTPPQVNGQAISRDNAAQPQTPGGTENWVGQLMGSFLLTISPMVYHLNKFTDNPRLQSTSL
jgi:hypothetical protein